MTIRIRDGGNVLRAISRIRIRDAGGVLRTVQRIRIRDAGNVLRTVYAALSASVSPGSASGIAGTATVTTGTVTASAVGGIGPFNYLWSFTSFSAFTSPSFTAGTSATCAFEQSGMLPGDNESAVAVCTITDTATGFAADTPAVPVFWTRT